jgi:transposase InsO family protein
VLDVFSRRIVGWAMAGHVRTKLVIDALVMAIRQRQPRVGVIHHSDQGTQTAPINFGQHACAAGVPLSVAAVGSCFDDAVTESFFATLECELLDRTVFHTRDDQPAFGVESSPVNCAPGRIRTCDTWFRKPLLYPLSYEGRTGEPTVAIEPTAALPHASGRA